MVDYKSIDDKSVICGVSNRDDALATNKDDGWVCVDAPGHVEKHRYLARATIAAQTAAKAAAAASPDAGV